jgi:hypothetical protein
MANIQLSELPRMFQDCMTAARQLGVQYIWIDSLCIILDNRDNWARRAQCMDMIYENALFTLPAVCSEGSVPFLGPGAASDRHNRQAVNMDIDAESTKPQSAEKRHPPAQLKARRYGHFLSPIRITGPPGLRSWTWQERYLSVRIINITHQEARWQCKASKSCECVGVMQSLNPRTEVSATPQIVIEKSRYCNSGETT